MPARDLSVSPKATDLTTYASVADVESANKQRKLGQGNNPTAVDVRLYLENAEAEINAILVNKGYEVPIDKTLAPQAFQLVRRINIQGAIAEMEEASGNGPMLERAERVYQASLKELINSREIMDAPQNRARAKPRGPGVTAPASTPYFGRDTPIF